MSSFNRGDHRGTPDSGRGREDRRNHRYHNQGGSRQQHHRRGVNNYYNSGRTSHNRNHFQNHPSSSSYSHSLSRYMPERRYSNFMNNNDAKHHHEVPINAKNWNRFNFAEQMKSQFTDQEVVTDYGFWHFIPEQTDTIQMLKDYAAESTIKFMKDIIPKQCYTSKGKTFTPTKNNTTIIEGDTDDEYDSGDDYILSSTQNSTAKNNRSSHVPYSDNDIMNYVTALKYNLRFNAGFYALCTKRIQSREYREEKAPACICPLSRTMKKWRENFGITYLSHQDTCNCSNYFGTKAFTDHLKGNCKEGPLGCGYYHLATMVYISHLHGFTYKPPNCQKDVLCKSKSVFNIIVLIFLHPSIIYSL